ncbi:MAG: HK97-gp10 family putative phage morphogenesis protein [Hyphomicrobium sp.]|jgi:HK97 gp10 family phage protein
MTEFVNVKGFKELQTFLDQLPTKMEANVMRSALRAGAKVVLEEAKLQVPVKDSDLRKSLRISTRSRSGTVTASVKSDLYYAKWVEYGTAPHLIKVSDKDRPMRMTRHGPRKISMRTINKMIASGSLVIGGNFVGPMIKHPGAKPKPFMRPALDTKSNAALLAVGEAIKKRLAKKHGLDASGVDLEIN